MADSKCLFLNESESNPFVSIMEREKVFDNFILDGNPIFLDDFILEETKDFKNYFIGALVYGASKKRYIFKHIVDSGTDPNAKKAGGILILSNSVSTGDTIKINSTSDVQLSYRLLVGNATVRKELLTTDTANSAAAKISGLYNQLYNLKILVKDTDKTFYGRYPAT